MSTPRNDQAMLVALAATHFTVAGLLLTVLRFVMNSLIPQFAQIGVVLELSLPWHLRALIEVNNVLTDQGWVLALLGCAWFVWRLRQRAWLEEFVRVAAGLNALAFALMLAACVSSLVYVQGTLLSLMP